MALTRPHITSTSLMSGTARHFHVLHVGGRTSRPRPLCRGPHVNSTSFMSLVARHFHVLYEWGHTSLPRPLCRGPHITSTSFMSGVAHLFHVLYVGGRTSLPRPLCRCFPQVVHFAAYGMRNSLLSLQFHQHAALCFIACWLC
jgi:hypothetical protein